MPQAPSTRWCPTPEQLMILEEMYRSGLRTPNASQIQQITAHLSFYGKIEGKNVFYWFQNHKARDRQKLRRRLISRQQMPHQLQTSPQLPLITSLPSAAPHHFPELYHQQLQPHFHHMQGRRLLDESRQGMDLLRKLETGSGRGDFVALSTGTSSSANGCDWAAMMTEPSNDEPCCRPLKTLELFPTKSTGGLQEEYCSTSNTFFPSSASRNSK